MKFYLKLIILTLLFCVNWKSIKAQDISIKNEIEIYNAMLGDVYNYKTCIFDLFYRPKDWKDTNALASKRYQEKMRLRVNNYNEFEKELTLDLKKYKNVIFLKDSLISLKELTKYRDYLLKNKIDKRDTFTVNFLRNFKSFLPAKKLNVNLIKQEQIKFIKSDLYPMFGMNKNKVISNDTVYLCNMCLSRVYISPDKQTGFFYFQYRGNNECGYGKFFIIRKQNGNWTIYKSIKAWGS